MMSIADKREDYCKNLNTFKDSSSYGKEEKKKEEKGK